MLLLLGALLFCQVRVYSPGEESITSRLAERRQTGAQMRIFLIRTRTQGQNVAKTGFPNLSFGIYLHYQTLLTS